MFNYSLMLNEPRSCVIESVLKTLNFTFYNKKYHNGIDAQMDSQLNGADSRLDSNSKNKFSYLPTAELHSDFSSYIVNTKPSKNSIGQKDSVFFVFILLVILLSTVCYLIVVILLYVAYGKSRPNFIFLRTLGLLLAQSTDLQHKQRLSVSIVICTWLYTSLVLSDVLQGLMYSFLTQTPKFIPPNSLEELLQQYKVYTENYMSNNFSYLEYSIPPDENNSISKGNKKVKTYAGLRRNIKRLHFTCEFNTGCDIRRLYHI